MNTGTLEKPTQSEYTATATTTGVPHVVIIGAGFGGVAAAKGLRNAPVKVTVIDRRNHHLFQPQLYQVAIAALSPADIAEPLRRALGKQRNVEVVLGEVTDIDTQGQQVLLQDRSISYDYLIVATGAQYNYFGHDEWGQRQKERANWREPLALSLMRSAMVMYQIELQRSHAAL